MVTAAAGERQFFLDRAKPAHANGEAATAISAAIFMEKSI
jgi:hypothetical protein